MISLSLMMIGGGGGDDVKRWFFCSHFQIEKKINS